MGEVIDGMDNADYHAHPALGSTSLKTLATKTPAHYKYDQDHPRHSDAFDLGTAVHSITLEDDESGIAEVDASSWQTKAAKEAKEAARAEGKVPLLSKDLAVARAMRDSIMSHPTARAAFTGHVAERSIFWEEDGLGLKCRPDALHVDKGVLIDLKTAVSADPRQFAKTVADYGYHQSVAHYRDGCEQAYGKPFRFLFVVVEKSPPYLVSVIELDELSEDYGQRLNGRAKQVYRECAEADRWPGYPGAPIISIPRWAEYQADEILGEDE